MLPEIDEVKKKRKGLGLTQKELAQRCSLSQSTIAKIEAKKMNPSYSIMKKIFDVLEEMETTKEIKAQQIMSKHVIGVTKGEKVLKAISLMKKHGYSQLPVFDGKSRIGSISEKTMLDKIINGEDPSTLYDRPVEEIVNGSFPEISKDASLNIISDLLRHYPAVLVTEKGEVLGIITKADLFKIK